MNTCVHNGPDVVVAYPAVRQFQFGACCVSRVWYEIDVSEQKQPFLKCMLAGVRPLLKKTVVAQKTIVQLLISATGLGCVVFLILALIYEQGRQALGGRGLPDDALPSGRLAHLCVANMLIASIIQLTLLVRVIS